MSMTSTTKLSTEHSEWLRSLDFYKEELLILKGRLTEVAGKNTGEEAETGAGHFENQFKIQVTNIDSLRHDIQKHLAEIAEETEQTAGHMERSRLEMHDTLRERFAAEEKVVNELRQEFNRYAAKWM